jgi:type I restriction enzyme, S subunit
MRGRLTHQDSNDAPAAELLEQISVERDRMVEANEIRKPKKFPAVEQDEVAVLLPSTWTWVRANEFFISSDSGWSPQCLIEQAGPGEWGVLKTSAVSRGAFDATANKKLPPALRPRPQLEVHPGEYVMIRASGSKGLVGRGAIATETESRLMLSDKHIRLSFLSEVSARFWAILNNSTEIQRYYSAESSGTSTMSNVTRDRIGALAVPVPPLAEQLRIVERVEELMGLCGELESQQAARVEARNALTSATLHRLSRAEPARGLRHALADFAHNIDVHLAPGDGDLVALKQLRQTILDLAVRGRLTHKKHGDEPAVELLKRISAERDRMVKAKEIRKPRAQAGVAAGGQEFGSPAAWEWAPLGELVLFSDSGWSPACLPLRRTDDSQWGVLKVSAVSWGEFRADEHKLLTPGLIPRPQIEVQDGDFLMSRANTAELVGRSVVVADPPPRLMLSDKHVRLRFLDRASAAYVNLVNGSSRARRYYASVATGTSDSMRNIAREQILALPIPVPPIAEQKRIVDVVNVLRSHCDELEQQLLNAQSRRLGLSESVVAHAVAIAV